MHNITINTPSGAIRVQEDPKDPETRRFLGTREALEALKEDFHALEPFVIRDLTSIDCGMEVKKETAVAIAMHIVYRAE